jgi:hypothetical protein
MWVCACGCGSASATQDEQERQEQSEANDYQTRTSRISLMALKTVYVERQCVARQWIGCVSGWGASVEGV